MNNVIITRSRRLNIPSTPRTGLPAALSWIAMAVVVVAFLAPLAWMIFASFDPSATFVTKLPRHASLGPLSICKCNILVWPVSLAVRR